MVMRSTFLDKKLDVHRSIRQLKPNAKLVKFVDCYQQRDTFSCGPIAIANYWALVHGFPPHRFKSCLQPKDIRRAVLKSIEHDKVYQLIDMSKCSSEPKKKVMKTFRLWIDEVY